MSSKVFHADCTGVRLVPWRAGQEPQDPEALRPRKAVFGAARVNPAANRTPADEMQERLNDALQKGFEAGEKAARQACENDLRRQTEELARTIAEIAGLRCETLQRAEADVVQLSIEIARRILHRELAVGPSAVESLIKAALEKLKQQEIYRVRVCPGEEELVRACLEQAGRGQAVEIVTDASRPARGAFFEINRGALDASVDTQLAEIERGLLDELRMRTAK